MYIDTIESNTSVRQVIKANVANLLELISQSGMTLEVSKLISA